MTQVIGNRAKELTENVIENAKILFGEDFGVFKESDLPPEAQLGLKSKLTGEYKAAFVRPLDLKKSAKESQNLLEAGTQPLRITYNTIEQEGEGTKDLMQIDIQEKEDFILQEKTRLQIPDSTALIRSQIHNTPTPEWHAPWKLMRVISGHIGWVRCVAVDVSNEWFATGSADRVIKIWDVASGTLKLSLTGHVSTVRALAISPRHPYLFSSSEDNQVKCWDLEVNRVIRHYHGHLSGVFSLALHPTLDVLVTGGRDSTARVWDMRTRQQIHCLTGHGHSVSSIITQEADPQIITGSHDSTIRLWDLAAGKTMTTLTHHKKSVRALVANPNEFTFASASADNIKQWKCPEGNFLQNMRGHNAIVNTLAVNHDNVMFSGGDNGSMHFWDWKSGYCFQKTDTIVQPGSLDSEAGIFCSAFDRSGSRLITGEADKSIKIWKEDETATPETHPIDWKPSLKRDHY